MTLITRNVADFVPTGAPSLDPYDKGGRHSATVNLPFRPVAQLVPYQSDDRSALEQSLADVARRRACLGTKGVRLKDVLASGETVRGLAHGGHRY